MLRCFHATDIWNGIEIISTTSVYNNLIFTIFPLIFFLSKFWRIGSIDLFYYPNMRVLCKPRGRFLYMSILLTKTLSGFPNSSPGHRNNSRKMKTKTVKIEILKKGVEWWFRFSQLVAPVKQLRLVFFLQPIINKKSLGF